MRTLHRSALACLLGFAALVPLAGCHPWDPIGQFVWKDPQYVNLRDQTVAVVVSIPRHILDPDAARDLGTAISRRLATNEDLKEQHVAVIPYSRVQAFVDENPYWAMRAPAAIQKSLGVTRLVWVDINEFRTHEEGASADLIQAVGNGSVRVLEAEKADANQFAFSQYVQAFYPSRRRAPQGSPASGALTPEVARDHLVQEFATRAAGIFYGHMEETEP